MRRILFAALMLVGSIATPATAAVSVSIGISVPSYPVLQRVPGYPVYYAPRLSSNYFFYDGLYWVYEGDDWYSSPWYNGPWDAIDRYEVPVYLLRVPVRYYRSAPVYFRSYRADAAPRWGDHWGRSWEQRRTGWDRWNRSSAPAPAPLPVYQRQYSGNRYPDRSQQVVIQTQSYRYEPREAVVRQRFEQRRASVPNLEREARRENRQENRQERREAVRAQPVPQPRVAQAPIERGHPPGNAKGWEGADRPPGQAKGWDKESRGNQGRGNDDRGNDDRGRGRDKDKDKEDRGKGKDR